MKFGITLSTRRAPPTYVTDALRSSRIDFVEIPVESYLYRTDSLAKAELKRILEAKPATAHGYSLSLLDPAPWSNDRLARHASFFEPGRFLAWSDHYAVTSWMGRKFSALTPAPCFPEAVQLLRERLALIQSQVPQLPFYLENPAAPFLLGDQTETLSAFSAALTGSAAGMLLDVSNLVANEINFGIPAEEELERVKHLKIGEIHLAGGHWHGTFFRDSHASPVGKRSFELLARLRDQFTQTTLLTIEREQNHPEFSEIEKEIDHARYVCGV